ncbi:MAG: hypothetical protein OK439_00595 [Thaumarchaeota archaeon]|nr:hypothetical protein [Nitrososphaerota archaeon]
MQNVSDESSDKVSENANSTDLGTNLGRFGREVRLTKNSCPLCNFVQKEIEKGFPLPVEEWIYISHLKNAHGIEP